MLLKLESLHTDGLFSEEQVKKVQQNVEMMCELISHICSRLPTQASKCYLLLTSLSSYTTVMSAVRTKTGLEEEVKNLMSICQKRMKMAQDSAERKQQTRRVIGRNQDYEIPPDDFSELSIFPTVQDMEWNERPFLRANKTKGGYRNVHHYLDVQFRLLREDYIRPLRTGIREYQAMKEKGESLMKNQDLRLYHNVKVIGLACEESLEHRIQFDNTHLKNIRWESSKRLLYGSLVCLSRDDFQSMYFAVVTNRETKDLEEGIIQIRFENGLQDILDASSEDTFTMAETSALFEAYRHVLGGLQEMKTSFPLARYIVECKVDVKPPKYLRAHGTAFNFRHLFDYIDYYSQDSPMLALLSARWPSFENTRLNQSQYDAVQTALTKEIAIIQGSPGTGKTYVGLKVAQILLDNRQVWTQNIDPKPMLVVCYTNHALDQFLAQMTEFCPNGIVRVGSRCTKEFLEQYNLKKIRLVMRSEKKVRLDIHNSIKDCSREQSVLRERVERLSATLEATTKGIIGEKALKMEMPEQHCKSLLEKDFHVTGRPNSIMMYWLTEGMLMKSDDKGEKDGCESLEKKVMQKILEAAELKQDPSFERSEIYCLHPKKKAQMYRFWLNKIKDQLRQTLAEESDANLKQQLVELEDQYTKDILPDSMLKQVMDRSIFTEITQASSQSRWQQSDYRVRAWLGLSTDRHSLQNLLDQLQEEDKGEEEEAKLNAEEDAEYLQRERQLDDDDDDDDDDFAKRHNEKDMDGWLLPKQHGRKQVRKLQHLIRTSQAMSEEEASAITDVWSQDQRDRVRLYLYWRERYQTPLKLSIKVNAEMYEMESARMRELKFAEDRDILRRMAVIGMTTTGAARYRSVLKDIGCPIVLLEEAAEVSKYTTSLLDFQLIPLITSLTEEGSFERDDEF
ncbi:hypothetical protein C0Q70_19517 [Pomacea canaliculata]|uniref:Uncharacterized protein n=1 Tax=Pomacea canaliculata TaxID=400727 RepID=A0A2T7NJJ5_POMCA|nr:hypothetical protein C0Q70_19517 [Pomacea canaliculata]